MSHPTLETGNPQALERNRHDPVSQSSNPVVLLERQGLLF
jgi:hypothetical protein